MARIRTIKPEFWTDDSITECSLSARLLFIGTWNFADDAGNLDRSAKQIKSRVFPVDSIDCEPLVQELIAHGLVSEYSAEGKKYLHIHGFRKHQLINRPSFPVCPPFPDSLNNTGDFTEDSLSTHAGMEGNGREGEISPDVPSAGSSDDDPVKAMFDIGVKILTSEGKSAQSARGLIGRLRKGVGDQQAMTILMSARDKTNPSAYIAKAMTPKERKVQLC